MSQAAWPRTRNSSPLFPGGSLGVPSFSLLSVQGAGGHIWCAHMHECVCVNKEFSCIHVCCVCVCVWLCMRVRVNKLLALQTADQVRLI